MRLPFIFISIHTLLVCSISFEGIAAHGHGVNHSNHTVHKGGCCKGHGVHDPDENFTTDTTAETFQGFLQQARDLLGKSVDSKLPKVMPSITTKKTSPSVSHEMPLLKIVGESKYFLVHEGHVGITYERIQEAVKAIKVAVADTYGLEDGDQAAATLLEFRNAIRNFSLVENRFKMVPRPWQCAASYESSKLSLQPCRECATYVNLKSLRYPLEKPSLIHQFKLLKENCLLSVGFQATFNPDYPYVLFSLSKPDGNIVVLRDDTIIKRLSLDGGPFTVSKMMKLRKTIDSQDQIYFSPKLDVFFNVHDSTPHYIDDLIFTLDTEFKKIYLQFYGVSSDRYEYSVSEQKAYFAFMKKIMSTLDNVTIVINNLTFNEELSCPQVPLYNESHISTSQKNLESKMAEDKSILVYYKKSVTTESMLSPGKTYQDKSIGWKGGNYQKLSYGKSFTNDLRDLIYDVDKKTLTGSTPSEPNLKTIFSDLSDSVIQVLQFMEDQHLALVSHVKAPNRPRSEEDLNAELEKAKAMKDARDAASRAEELKAKKERQAELEKKIARANEAAEDTRNAPRLTMPDDNGSEMGFSDIFSTDVDLGSSMDEDMPTPYRLVEIQEDSGNPEFEDSRNKYYDL